MAKKYIGRVRILMPCKPGEPEPEVVFGPRFLEENAESAPDARDKIEAAARRRWRPRRNRGEVIVIDFVRPKQPRRARYYAFRFAAEGDITARHGTYWGNIEYVPEQLYGFDSCSARDAWVQEGGRVDEIRRAVKAGKLPKGWKADHALDPETEAVPRQNSYCVELFRFSGELPDARALQRLPVARQSGRQAKARTSLERPDVEPRPAVGQLKLRQPSAGFPLARNPPAENPGATVDGHFSDSRPETSIFSRRTSFGEGQAAAPASSTTRRRRSERRISSENRQL